jgi:hypothetical protein
MPLKKASFSAFVPAPLQTHYFTGDIEQEQYPMYGRLALAV